MTASFRPHHVLLVLGVLGLGVFPFVGDEFYVDLAVRLMIMGIFAMSLDLLIGYTGLVSFGHAAFFGFAGYMLAIITPQDAPIAIWWALPACLGATALVALVIGWFSVRTSGIYFIMITLAFAQMLFYFFNENAELGSSDGIYINFKPAVVLGSFTLVDLEDQTVFYFLTLASLIGAYALLATVLRAPFGQVVRGIKANEARTRALGFATQRYKLVSFVISGTLAGFAGFLEASYGGFMSPAHLGWHESGLLLMMVILGGIGTLYGPVIGAFLLGGLQFWFEDLVYWLMDLVGLFEGVLPDAMVGGVQDFLGVLPEHWFLVLGILIILVVLLLPNGIAGLIERRKAS